MDGPTAKFRRTGPATASEEAIPTSAYGSVYVGDVRRSLRRNPQLAIHAAVENIAAAMPDEEVEEAFADLGKLVAEVESKTGAMRRKKHQRGGSWWEDLKLDVSQKLAVLKAVTMLAADKAYRTTGSAASSAAAAASSAASAVAAASPVSREDVKNYVIAQYITPLGGVGKRLTEIVIKLGDQAIVKLPVTGVMVVAAGAGYTLNFIAEVVKLINEAGRGTTESLLLDKRAADAAKAAVADAKSGMTTAMVGVVAANQLGLLPISAVLAAILFSLQLNLGTGGGRAYLITGFYAWYAGQSKEKQAQIKKAAEDYAEEAKKAAPTKQQATAAAAKLGGYLSAAGSSAAGAGKSLVNTMVDAAKAAGTWREKATDKEPASVVPASAEAALQSGTAAAAIAALAVEAVEDGAAPLVAVGEGDGAAAASSSSSSSAAAAPSGRSSRRAAAAVGAPVAAPGNKKRDRAALSADAPEFSVASSSSSAAAVGPDGDGAASSQPVGKKGGRKTRKPKSKRRVTRRRKAQKILGTPVFVY